MNDLNEIETIKGSSNSLISSYRKIKDSIVFNFEIYHDFMQITAVRDLIWYKSEVIKSNDFWDIILKDIKDGFFKYILKESNIFVILPGITVKLDIDNDVDKHMREIFKLTRDYNQLKNDFEDFRNSKPSSNIVWVTTHVDNTRRSYSSGENAISFKVDKKKSNSYLLIQGTLCVKGETNAETGQTWTYGNKTVAFGQTESYMNNSGYGRPVTSFSVIKNHTETGKQDLNLKWNSSMVPFTIINPNKIDHVQYYDVQTCSVFTVWEILEE
jgi:hypothetical protein